MPTAVVPELSSKIHAVTVFRHGAVVRRRAELAPEGGSFPRRVKIAGLPLSLDDASVRIHVLTAGDQEATTPIASSFRVTLDIPSPDATLAPPDDAELRLARQEEALWAARQEVLRAQRTRLDLLQLRERPRPPRGETPRPSPTSARVALVDLADATVAALDEALAAARVALARAAERRRGLEDRDRRVSSAREPRIHELRKCVELELEAVADGAADVALEVEYAVPGARWAPAYAVHLERDLDRARVTLRAQISQRTGEDWTEAVVTCSTAAIERWAELPELPSLRIGRYQAEPARTGFREAPVGAEELYADLDRVLGAAGPTTSTLEIEDVAEDEVTGEFAASELPAADHRAGFGGAPPPAQAQALAMPMSMSAPLSAPQEMGAMAAAPMAPPPMRAAGRKAAVAVDAVARLAKMPASIRSERDEVTDLFDVRDLPVELAAPIGLDPSLDYGNLRLRGYAAPERGHLVVAATEELYLEHVEVRRIEWTALLRRTLTLVHHRAHQLAAPPPRHVIPDGGSYDYAYPSATTVDVPSDGEYHAIPLSAAEGGCAAHFVVVPRESNDAYRVVELDNPFDSPLLAGPADVYVGQRYLMTSDVLETPPGATLRLGLGVEQRIKVARNASFVEETRGLMRGSLDLAHDVRMEIVSHLPAPARIEVRERLPVTRDSEEQIKIVVDVVDPPWEPYDQEDAPVRGSHRWWVDVAPGGRADLRMAYTVRIASKSELVGGNRRER